MQQEPLQFADFELDAGRYTLTRRGRAVKLERIPMELLILLLERRPHLVTREEIAARLWGAGVFVDAAGGINTAVLKLRRVLKDSPARPAFIETVSGKGYRFIAPVTTAGGAPSPSPIADSAPSKRLMLAVLPFEDLSSSSDREYFSDGLTEETISQLGRINPEQLGVIARTSSMAYKRTRKSIAAIGRELGVDYILESSVRHEGQRIRVTSQLIRVADQTHLWASNYDRDIGSFLGVQSDLGSVIADQVRIRLVPGIRAAESPARPRDADAYDLYLRGRFYWNQLTPSGIQRGIRYFQEALDKDPGYALAYAGLADCYSMLPITCDAPALEILPKALAAAHRAVELDNDLAEAHSALGTIKLWMEWDWAGAEAAFRRALSLNSSYVSAHRYYGHLLSNLGRHAESEAEMTRAREVDPLSPIIHALSGRLLYQARHYDSALRLLKNALAIDSDLWVIHAFLGGVYERLLRFDEAAAEYQRALELSGGNATESIAFRGHILAQLGKRAEAEQTIGVLKDLSAKKYVPPCNLAIVHAGLGDVDAAIGCLEEAYATRDVRLTFLAVEPKWDTMRSDARFQSLLRRLGLPLDAAPPDPELTMASAE